MCAIPSLQRVFASYVILSSSTIGFVEFYHDFVQNKKNAFMKQIIASNSTNISTTKKDAIELECFKKSLPGFFFGALLGPAVPIFYLAGVKALDWKRCPKLK